MTLYRLRDQQMKPFRSTALETHYQEKDLEDWLEHSPGVVTDGEPILIIARQPAAGAAGTPDLIGLDQDGNTIVIELKRGRPPRVTLNDQYANDFYLRFPSQVEPARAVAQLVLEHVAGRIA